MPSVTIFSEDRQASISLERIAHESYDFSQQCLIYVVDSSFRGSVSAWFDERPLKKFVNQLCECEKQRRGEASLSAMTGDEFSLRIFNTHAKGDFALTYQLKDFSPRFPLEMTGGFDLDPSLLLQILRDFETLAIIENRYPGHINPSL